MWGEGGRIARMHSQWAPRCCTAAKLGRCTAPAVGCRVGVWVCGCVRFLRWSLCGAPSIPCAAGVCLGVSGVWVWYSAQSGQQGLHVCGCVGVYVSLCTGIAG